MAGEKVKQALVRFVLWLFAMTETPPCACDQCRKAREAK